MALTQIFKSIQMKVTTSRDSRYFSSALVGIVGRILTLIILVASVPLTIEYYGKEIFGIWMAISGVVSFLQFADLGFSLGLQNELSGCLGRNDRSTPRALISNGISFQVMMFIVVILLSIIVLPQFSVGKLIKTNTVTYGELEIQSVIMGALIAFSLGLIGNIFVSILTAYQYGFIASASSIIGKLLSFIWLIICGKFQLQFGFLIVGFIGLPNLVNIAGLILLLYKKEWLRPKQLRFSFYLTKRMLSFGGYTLLGQLNLIIMMSGPPLLIASKYGASMVAEYSIVQRLFGMASMPFSVMMLSLWPMYTHSKVRNEYSWIKNKLKQSVLFVFFLSLPIYCLVYLYKNELIQLWSGIQIIGLTFYSTLIIVLWEFIKCQTEVFAIYLLGMNRMKCATVIVFFSGLAAYFIALNADSIDNLLLIFILFGGLVGYFAMALRTLLLQKEYEKIAETVR